MSRPIERAPRASIAPVEIDLQAAPVDDPADERATPIRAERVSTRFVELIPREFARQHLILSQGTDNGVERLAVTKTSDPAAVFNVGVRLSTRIETQLANGESIAQLIDDVYERHANADDHAAHDTSDELTSGGGGRINVNTAPREVVEQALRAAGRGGLELVLAARVEGRSVSLGDLRVSSSSSRAAPQIIGSSFAWSFRIDVQVGPLRRSWWAVYMKARSTWECVQRLAIAQ